MKHLNFNNLIQMLLALIITLFIFSCQKYENVKEPVKVATETRTGQNELVFFSKSGLFASSDETDTIQNLTGDYNVAIGSQAGYSTTTGSNSTYLGYAAGYYNTTSNRLYIIK